MTIDIGGAAKHGIKTKLQTQDVRAPETICDCSGVRVIFALKSTHGRNSLRLRNAEFGIVDPYGVKERSAGCRASFCLVN